MSWISVDERTPDEPGFYQVYAEADGGNAIHGFWWNGKNWCFDNDMYEGEPLFTAGWYVSVTHWRENPEPPTK